MEDSDLEHDAETGRYRVEFDIEERDPSTVVVAAVSDVSDTDPLELESLHECVDPDCLDGIFRSKHDGTKRSGGHVTFRFAGFEVSVWSSGEVVLDPEQ